jgi:hypothetical protein
VTHPGQPLVTRTTVIGLRGLESSPYLRGPRLIPQSLLEQSLRRLSLRSGDACCALPRRVAFGVE